MSDRVPDLILERYALGELSPAKMEETRERLEAEPGGIARLAQLQLSNAEILDKYPERWFEGVVANRQWRNPGRNRSMLMVSIPVLAMAALALIVSMPTITGPGPGADGPDEIIRTKGDARLEVYRKEAGGQTQLHKGARAAAGDMLQLRYVPNGMPYGAVYSVDGRGTVTRHLPIRGDDAVALNPEATSLPKAYELDDAPDYEQFWIVTGHHAFDLHAVQSALEGDAELPADLNAWSVTLTKEQR